MPETVDKLASGDYNIIMNRFIYLFISIKQFKGVRSMPKIIENAWGLILDEAKKQIREQGYAATTVRSVAAKCKVAIGTVYNYFPSKEILISSFMADD